MTKKILYYRIYCNTEASYTYTWKETTPTVCPNNNAHSIDTNTISILDVVNSGSGNFDNDGKLSVNPGGLTQFGEQRVSSYKPIFQNYALYNIINNQVYTYFSATGGTITGNVNGTEIDLNISASVGSYAVLRSTKVCKYRPGYNIIVRWNVLFAEPVANCLQFGGLGNNGSDVYFCYNGLDFGVRYSTGGYSEVRYLTITTAETTSTNATIVVNGVSHTVPLTDANEDTSFTAYQIAKYSFTGWSVYSVGNIVIFTADAVGSKGSTYSFSTGGTSVASFSQIKEGTALTTTFVNRTAWNGYSTMVQDLDPTKRNMYCIEYSWYGSGNMTFKVFNSVSSTYETVHTISFSNLYQEPSLTQPNMYLTQGIASLGSTSAKTIRVAGGFAATEGEYIVNYPMYSVDNQVSIAPNIETVIIALRNRDNIYGFTNNSEILIRQIVFNTDGNKGTTIRVIKNPTLLSAGTARDYTKWEYINESQSIGVVDKKSRTFTGGNVLATYFIPRSEEKLIDLNTREIFIHKRDVIIITATSTSICDIYSAVSIVEDY